MTPRCDRIFLFITLLAIAAPAFAQPREPHIGYVYPAGAQHGTTLQVTVGGQFLDNAWQARFFGEGITAKVIEHTKPLNGKELLLLRDRLTALRDRRVIARSATRPATMPAWTDAEEKEFEQIQQKLASNVRRPSSPAIAETITLHITIARTAQPGDREIRLRTPVGLSNPLVFRIGQFPETSEKPTTNAGEPTRAVPRDDNTLASLPAVANGQIGPGGVDRWRFHARAGQHLVVTAAARELIPYLPDAVPGWFQATLTLLDTKAREVAYCDDFRFSPDPVLYCVIPAEGDYTLEIKDAIYRGREDFVYRITIGQLPYLTGIFPLGARAGATTCPIELKGYNLQSNRLAQNLSDEQPGQTFIQARRGTWLSNPVPFAIDDLPESAEQKDHPTTQPLSLSTIFNGRIASPGETDVFSLDAKKGQQLVFEVTARRLGSPLDSVLRILAADGNQLAFNDDFEDRGAGMETHHADSRVAFTAPADGAYYLHLTDSQSRGGPDFAYRLRASLTQPDFALRVVPSAINLRPNNTAAITVHALRRDGFTGEIRLFLPDAPRGLLINPTRIPAGQNQVRLTLTIKGPRPDDPTPITIEGRANIRGREIAHSAAPADDLMQAFLYRHLVCARELLLTAPARRNPIVPDTPPLAARQKRDQPNAK